MRYRPPLLLLLCALVSGCASAGALPPVPTAAEIPSLEERLSANPGDLEAGMSLAAAYRGTGRTAEATALISDLLVLSPEDPGLLVMSGLLAEDAGSFAEARAAYEQVLTAGQSGPLAAEVERRLNIVRRQELSQEVRGALAREADIAQVEADAGSVGVFPFFYEGDDDRWAPLALALPEMLSTDLAVTGRLRVVERLHVQALLDEIELSESGRVDAAVGARSGLLLGSRSIVQGRFRVDEGQIDVDAAVVDVGRGDDETEPISDADALEEIFALEKRLALDIHAELGVQLTSAERERITERQTESIQALLAFGRGIEAENAGEYEIAQEHFSSAVSIDPDFGMAAARGRSVASMIGIDMAAVVGQVSALARQVTTKRQAVTLLRNTPVGLQDRVLQALGVQKRAVVQEVTGQDRIGQAALLELIFRAPGGGP